MRGVRPLASFIASRTLGELNAGVGFRGGGRAIQAGRKKDGGVSYDGALVAVMMTTAQIRRATVVIVIEVHIKNPQL